MRVGEELMRYVVHGGPHAGRDELRRRKDPGLEDKGDLEITPRRLYRDCIEIAQRLYRDCTVIVP